MATKFFCDGCKEEVTHYSKLTKAHFSSETDSEYRLGEFCYMCVNKIKKFINDLGIKPVV